MNKMVSLDNKDTDNGLFICSVLLEKEHKYRKSGPFNGRCLQYLTHADPQYPLLIL